MAIRGSPDFFLNVFGKFCALELKSSNGKESGLQKLNKYWVEKTNGIWLVAYPQNWQHIKNRLVLMSEGQW